MWRLFFHRTGTTSPTRWTSSPGFTKPSDNHVQGSFTTHGFAEGVTWLVLTNPISVSSATLSRCQLGNLFFWLDSPVLVRMKQLRYSGPSSPRMANNCRCNISQIIGRVWDFFLSGAPPALVQGACGDRQLRLSSFNSASKPCANDFVVTQLLYIFVSCEINGIGKCCNIHLKRIGRLGKTKYIRCTLKAQENG